MSHTTAVNPGLGTVLGYGVSPTNYAQVVSIDGPEAEVGTADTTNLSSTWKSYRPTLPDGGELSMTIQFDPQDPTHLELQGLLLTPPQAGTAFTLTFNDTTGTTPTHTSWAFTGILTKLKPTGMEAESNLEAEVTIKVTGAITHTP